MFSSMLSLLGSLRRGNFVQNSLRFRSSASAYLNRTPSVAGNRKTWTWSGWVKRGTLTTGQWLFGAGPVSTDYTTIRFGSGGSSNDFLEYVRVVGSVIDAQKISSAVYRDTSAWYHIVVAEDAINTVSRVYVNGSEIAYSTNDNPSNVNGAVNNTGPHEIGRYVGSALQHFDGYLTEVNFIDGQALTPSSFGQIETTTGVWSPKQYAGSYGTNGFYLKFGNTSSVAALGTDSSGNNNTWTVNNVSLTAGATYDSMIDVPVNYSDGGNGRGNYAVLNPLAGGLAPTNGNLTCNQAAAAWSSTASTLTLNTGKWYFEIGQNTLSGSNYSALGLRQPGQLAAGEYAGSTSGSYGAVTSGTTILTAYSGGVAGTVLSGSYTANSIFQCAVDFDAGKIWFGNGVSWIGGGSPESGTTPTYTFTPGTFLVPYVSAYANQTHANFGQRPFAYTPPAGFRALNTNNLPTPTIVNGANFMAATTYTGNGAARSLSNAVNNVSFQPDLVWIKSRTPGATSHALFDSVRGATRYLSSNTTAIEVLNANTLPAFTADGFSLGTDTTLVNASANSYVAWQWKAGGAAVSNTQGTITSQVSANTTAGFSVVTWTGNNGTNATVGHGLGVVPRLIITKARTASPTDWPVYHANLSAGNSIFLSTTAAQASGVWYPSAPSSTVFTTTWPGNSSINASTINYVSYIFAEIAGFSKFGSYTGNGLLDGPFVFCGFRPRFVMVKRTDVAADWVIFDSSRNTSNLTTQILEPSQSLAEITGSGSSLDLLSSGVKMRGAGLEVNVTNGTYIFAAFAEVPSKYALAR